MLNRSRLWMLALMLGLAGPSMAQTVDVYVDGQRVFFSDTQPQIIGGRVLVPLRGVLEKMGATVGWAPATRTVTAQRGDLTLALQIGQREASVGGRLVYLDVPAMILGGSTMVPLRFVSEALGANVEWQAATRTVLITTAGGPAPQPDPQPDPTPQPQPDPQPQPQPDPTPPVDARITNFAHNADQWLNAGETIEVRMQGTPGGRAVFFIPGVVEDVLMQEAATGQYVGTWTVPAQNQEALTVSGAAVIGRLRVGERETALQAAQAVSVDNQPPILRAITPEPDSAPATVRPIVTAVYDDEGGSGIVPKGIVFRIDGNDVTSEAAVTPQVLTWQPNRDLASGRHTAGIRVRDAAGNDVVREWSFTITNVADLVDDFTHNGYRALEPGDVVQVALNAQAGGRATFSIGEFVTGAPMREVEPGVYRGEYTVRKGERVADAPVTGTFTTAAGRTIALQAEQPAGKPDVMQPQPGQPTTPPPAGELEAPRITNPQPNETVASPLVVRGTAPANSRVQLRIEYRATILFVPISGVLAEQQVDVGDDGRFETRGIELNAPGGATYVLKATTVTADGQRSETTEVRFRAR